MKRIAQLLFALVVVTTLAGAASAGTETPRVDRRQVNQRVRIHQGVQSGRLTPREARHLRRGQRHIRRVERRAKSDGVVTPGERARMNHMQNRESRRIYRLKHNGRSI
jgi:hypothetical protein